LIHYQKKKNDEEKSSHNIELVADLAEPKSEAKETVSPDKEVLQKVQQTEPDSTQLEELIEQPTTKVPEESPETEISSEVSTQQKQPEAEMITEVAAEMITEVAAEKITEVAAEMITDVAAETTSDVAAENILKSDEDTDATAEVPTDKISTIPEEKETPMEVDVAVKDSTETGLETPPDVKESEPSDPPA